MAKYFVYVCVCVCVCMCVCTLLDIIYHSRHNFAERQNIKQKNEPPSEYDPEQRRKKILALKVSIIERICSCGFNDLFKNYPSGYHLN